MDLLVELCAGSAALTFRVACDCSPWVSYAGSKAGYTEALIDIMGLSDKKIVRFTLVDPGPWGYTLRLLCDEHLRKRTADWIDQTMHMDAKDAWKEAKELVAESMLCEEYAGAHLLSVAGTYGGVERGGFKGKHKLRPNVDGFIPSRSTISRRLRSTVVRPNLSFTVRQCRAEEVNPIPCYCYIDPPYRESNTKYVNSFAKVMVSENQPIDDLVKKGWFAYDITERRTGPKRRNSSSTQEWVTCNFSA